MKSRVKLQLSKGRDCVNCNTNDETTIPHHYKGLYQNDFWEKSKVYDIFTSDICFKCHTEIHTGMYNLSKEEKSLLQMLWILKTMKSDYILGYMVYDKFSFILHLMVDGDLGDIEVIRSLFLSILKDWKAGKVKYFKKPRD